MSGKRVVIYLLGLGIVGGLLYLAWPRERSRERPETGPERAGEPRRPGESRFPRTPETRPRMVVAGTVRDADGQYHLAKAYWRIGAALQLQIEADRAKALEAVCPRCGGIDHHVSECEKPPPR